MSALSLSLKASLMCLRSVTTAAKISPVIEVTAMKNCSKAALCSALRSMNGPCPCAVPQTAMAAVRKLATVDPAMPKRIAAQMTKGEMTKANTSSRMASPIRPPKIARQVTTSPIDNVSSSIHRKPVTDLPSCPPARRSGAMISTPIASPSHQTSHAEPKLDQGCTPARKRLVTPAEAARVVLTNAGSVTRPRTSRNRVRDGLNSVNRRKRYAPTRALEVLPHAMARVGQRGIGVRKFTRKDANAILGHMR